MNEKVILCVDDEKFVLDSLQRELERSFKKQFVIEEAENGSEALDIIDEVIKSSDELPVIIADYIMPYMKGDELLIKVHNVLPDTRKIMLTGQATMEGVTNAVNNASLYRYIAKPWERRDLAMTISEAVKSYDRDKKLKEQHREILEKNKEITEINKNLESLVAERTSDLKAKQKELTDSINYAKRIQSAIMGNPLNIRNVLPESSILYIPKDIVSGDFYWFSEKNGRKITAAGDCTGHGVPGAFMSLIGISLLNQIVNERGITNPARILEELRKMIIKLLKQTGKSDETKDGMDIALVSIDLENSILEYAGAYNPLYFIPFEKNAEHFFEKDPSAIYYDKLIEIKADRMPIGISEHEKKPFNNHTIKIYNEDLFFIYTDGLIDQFGGEKGKKMLSKRLKKHLIDICDLSLNEQMTAIKNYYFDWKGSEEQIDDVLIIGCRFFK